jgi:hypothetical protein
MKDKLLSDSTQKLFKLRQIFKILVVQFFKIFKIFNTSHKKLKSWEAPHRQSVCILFPQEKSKKLKF